MSREVQSKNAITLLPPFIYDGKITVILTAPCTTCTVITRITIYLFIIYHYHTFVPVTRHTHTRIHLRSLVLSFNNSQTHKSASKSHSNPGLHNVQLCVHHHFHKAMPFSLNNGTFVRATILVLCVVAPVLLPATIALVLASHAKNCQQTRPLRPWPPLCVVAFFVAHI